jgi:hypothetical protein
MFILAHRLGAEVGWARPSGGDLQHGMRWFLDESERTEIPRWLEMTTISFSRNIQIECNPDADVDRAAHTTCVITPMAH